GVKPLEHSDSVLAVAFVPGPDGGSFVSVSADGKLRRQGRRGDGQRELKQLGDLLPEQALSIALAEFSPDGRMLATVDSDQKVVRLWSLGGAEPVQLKEPEGGEKVLSIAFSPDAKVLVASDTMKGGVVRIHRWNTDTAKDEPLEYRDDNVKLAVVACADGGKIAVGDSRGGIRRWDGQKWLPPLAPTQGESADEQTRSRGEPAVITALAYLQDSSRIASLNNRGRIRLWDQDASRQPRSSPAPGNAALSLKFSPDGKKLAVASPMGSVSLLDVKNLEEGGGWLEEEMAPTLQGHVGAVRAVAFAADSAPGTYLIATGSDDKSVRLWEVSPQTETRVRKESDAVSLVTFSPDGRWLAIGRRGRDWNLSVSLHEVVSDGALSLRERSGEPIPGVMNFVFSPDGKSFATYGDTGEIRLWDVATRQPVLLGTAKPTLVMPNRPQGPDASVPEALPSAMAFRGDGAVLGIWSPNEGITLFDTVNRRKLGPQENAVSKQGLKVKSAAFSPDLKTLVLGYDNGSVSRFETETGRPQSLPKQTTSPVSAVAFSSDGLRLVTGSADTKLVIWNTSGEIWKVVLILNGQSSAVTSLAFAAKDGGRRLVSGGNDGSGSVNIWDIDPAHLDLHRELWSSGMRKRQQLATLSGPHGPALAVALSPDGKVLAVGSADGTVKLW
ncbi:MAG TPA: WD40 repeat domain-containing protein, partial [Pyrinomonadaceae bacterium]|nr:WD40 repeat domain-containing protein [Pyrinomonadaceae bacterium]